MTWKGLVEDIRSGAGLTNDSAAERGMRAVVSAVAPSIQPEDRRALPDTWPLPLRELILRSRYEGPLEEEALYREVARRLTMPTDLTELGEHALGHARELAQVVLRQLSSRLGPDFRRRLAHHAAPSMAWLWDPPPSPSTPEGRRRAPPTAGQGHTLASGRPGSRHPLSESGPLGHADSIARAKNPYEDRKISSARGTTAEQEHRTLAEGHPGSEHPVSDDRD